MSQQMAPTKKHLMQSNIDLLKTNLADIESQIDSQLSVPEVESKGLHLAQYQLVKHLLRDVEFKENVSYESLTKFQLEEHLHNAL